MNLENIISEISQTQKEKNCRIGQFIETGWNRGYQGLREGGWEISVHLGYRVSVWDDEKVLDKY